MARINARIIGVSLVGFVAHGTVGRGAFEPLSKWVLESPSGVVLVDARRNYDSTSPKAENWR